MRLSHSIDIAAPVARVWDLTLDVEGWPATTPTMTSVERLDDGPLSVGSTARVRQPGQGARVWTVTAVEDQRRFAWETRAFGCRMAATHELERTEGSTVNTLAIDLDGRAAGLVGRLLRRAVLSALAKENAGLKVAAERTAPRAQEADRAAG